MRCVSDFLIYSFSPLLPFFPGMGRGFVYLTTDWATDGLGVISYGRSVFISIFRRILYFTTTRNINDGERVTKKP